MEKEKIEGQLFAGPITDKGQLLLALAINQQAGEDGWVYKTVLVLGKRARLGKTAAYEKLAELEKMGLVERQMGPPHAVRIDRQAVLGDRETVIGDRQANSGGFRETVISDRLAVIGDRQTDSPSPSAYLPLKDKDIKDKDIAASPFSPSSADLMLVASNETPKSPRFDQPAAQPPAVVEQGDLLPAKPKAKPKAKRKRAPAENPKVRITDDWQPKPETLDKLEVNAGVPRAFAEAGVWKFITYWRDRGTARPGWDSTFIDRITSEWKWEQEREQKSEQARKYTDAAGRPISEATVTMQDAHDNVLAHADFFASLDPNKPV